MLFWLRWGKCRKAFEKSTLSDQKIIYLQNDESIKITKIDDDIFKFEEEGENEIIFGEDIEKKEDEIDDDILEFEEEGENKIILGEDIEKKEDDEKKKENKMKDKEFMEKVKEILEEVKDDEEIELYKFAMNFEKHIKNKEDYEEIKRKIFFNILLIAQKDGINISQKGPLCSIFKIK